jgi:CO/xanthine dehydrogenase Mo-binding subunit
MTTIGRREFLTRSAGLLVVGFNSRASAVPASAQRNIFTEHDNRSPDFLPPRRLLSPEEVDSWLTVSADGQVTVYTGRIDMGTGVETSFAQTVADELDVSFDAVTMIMGDTGVTPDQGKSTGSSNSSRGAQPLRTAAAEARLVLLTLAAERLQTPVDALTVRDGVVSVAANSGRKVTYGELLQGRRFDRRVRATVPGDGRGPQLQGSAPLKSRDFRHVGTSVRRKDVPAKVTATFPYVHTVRVPGMVHGRVVRPAAVGATLIGVDESSVRNIPSLIKVVRKGNFLGVVAEREEHAIQAARQLKAVWTSGTPLPDSTEIYRRLRTANQIKRETRYRGDVDAALSRATKVLKATYEWPVQNHAMIGPSCAVADVRSSQVTIWSGSQWPQQNRRDLAQLLGVPVETVRLIWVQASGSYGRLACDDAAADAALLSQAVARPVRVLWTRQDEHGWEPKSPAMVFDLRAGIDRDGHVVAFDLEQWSPSHSTAEIGNFLAWRLIGGNPNWDRLSGGEGDHAYTFENNRATAHYVEEMLRAIYLRAPGAIQHNFALESFIDELAAAVKMNPVEFRLRYLADPDMIMILEAVAKKAGWEAQISPRRINRKSGIVTGRGVCCSTTGRQSAAIADIDVDLDTGSVRVRKIVCAVACGRIINPEGVRHQVQGALIQGVSRTLLEEVKLERGRVTTLDWRSYPILTFPAVPEIETVLIDQFDKDPTGLGELATIPAAAVIGNAIFNATGARLGTIPFTPARVKAALSRI